MIATLLKFLGLSRKIDEIEAEADALRATLAEVNARMRAEMGLSGPEVKQLAAPAKGRAAK